MIAVVVGVILVAAAAAAIAWRMRAEEPPEQYAARVRREIKRENDRNLNDPQLYVRGDAT